MLELMLNAVKVLVSKDARDAGMSLLSIMRNSPEWKKDICNLSLRIDSYNVELTTLIREITAQKLGILEYPEKAIEAFNVIYVELTNNAFEHGLVNKFWRKGTIEIEVNISFSYVAIIVHNSKGVKFDLDETITDQTKRLTENPHLSRGRGLLLVRELSDQLISMESGNSIKAVLYKDEVVIDYFQLGNIAVLSAVSGIFNPSMPSRLKRFVLQQNCSDIILDFSRFSKRTTLISGGLEALRIDLAQKNQRVVVIGESDKLIFDVESVASWYDALVRLDRLDLQHELAKRGLE